MSTFAEIRATLVQAQKKRPAFIWILASEIAAVVVVGIAMLSPNGTCKATLGVYLDCPPSLGVVIVLGLAMYFVVLLALYLLSKE